MTEVLQLRIPCDKSIIGFGAGREEWEENRAFLEAIRAKRQCFDCQTDCPVKTIMSLPSFSKFEELIRGTKPALV